MSDDLCRPDFLAALQLVDGVAVAALVDGIAVAALVDGVAAAAVTARARGGRAPPPSPPSSARATPTAAEGVAWDCDKLGSESPLPRSSDSSVGLSTPVSSPKSMSGDDDAIAALDRRSIAALDRHGLLLKFRLFFTLLTLSLLSFMRGKQKQKRG